MTPRNLENNAAGGATTAATSVTCASITLQGFREFTRGMVGASRAALFTRLPSVMQARAYDDLDNEIRARSEELWAAEMRRRP